MRCSVDMPCNSVRTLQAGATTCLCLGLWPCRRISTARIACEDLPRAPQQRCGTEHGLFPPMHTDNAFVRRTTGTKLQRACSATHSTQAAANYASPWQTDRSPNVLVSMSSYGHFQPADGPCTAVTKHSMYTQQSQPDNERQPRAFQLGPQEIGSTEPLLPHTDCCLVRSRRDRTQNFPKLHASTLITLHGDVPCDIACGRCLPCVRNAGLQWLAGPAYR